MEGSVEKVQGSACGRKCEGGAGECVWNEVWRRCRGVRVERSVEDEQVEGGRRSLGGAGECVEGGRKCGGGAMVQGPLCLNL